MPTCYFCDAAATSREHVPPRCLFPELKDLPAGEDLRRNLISVPSCTAHNSAKSDDDTFLFWILTVPLQGNAYKERHFQTKGLRAFGRAPNTFINLMENLSPVVLKDQLGTFHESAAFEVDLGRFDRCMCRIAAGLHHYHEGTRWSGTYRVVTDAFSFLKGTNAASLNATMKEMSAKVSKAFAPLPDLGENPEIFKYKRFSDGRGRHAIQLTFYEGIQVSVAMLDE